MGPHLPFVGGGTGPSPLFVHGGTGPSSPFVDGGVGPHLPFVCGGAGSSFAIHGAGSSFAVHGAGSSSLFVQPGRGPHPLFVLLGPRCCWGLVVLGPHRRSCNLAWVLVCHSCYWALIAVRYSWVVVVPLVGFRVPWCVVRRPVHAERGERATRGLNRCMNHT